MTTDDKPETAAAPRASDFTPDEVQVLKAVASGLIKRPAAARSGEPLADHLLDSEWADHIVSKDPPRYDGPTMVGMRYSQASAEWLDAMASFCDWKAQKGRQEPAPRLNAKGKPWYERDEFEAKLCRAWAKRIRGNEAEGGGDDIPF